MKTEQIKATLTRTNRPTGERYYLTKLVGALCLGEIHVGHHLTHEQCSDLMEKYSTVEFTIISGK
jgi:hypothetical protein